jgi:geranylgeranyl reductase family protein
LNGVRIADIAVVGAGPAGAAAAIVAARAGLDVVLLDRATFPRDKCCGDGLTASCLRELEDLGLEAPSVPSWRAVRDVVLHAPSGRRVPLHLPAGPGWWSAVARRRELDAALVERAVKGGAELREGAAVSEVTPVEHGVELRAGGRRILAAAVVAADGMWSPVRKLCGADHAAGYRGEWHAFRQYFRRPAADAVHCQHVWFPADLLPAYIWSFPLADGTVNVGFGLQRGGAVAVGDGAALWRDILGRREVRAVLGEDLEPDSPMRAWPIPARIGRTRLVALGGRVLFAGDAATAPDPMTGEGIGQALLTGRLAAEVTVAARDRGRSPRVAAQWAGSEYRRRVRRELVADHRLARGLTRLLAHPAGAEAALRAVGATGWTRANFARWMFEDYPRALVGTPRRWRRGAMSAPAAYRSGRDEIRTPFDAPGRPAHRAPQNGA